MWKHVVPQDLLGARVSLGVGVVAASLLAVTAVTAIARADTQYRLHPRDGELLFDVLYPEDRSRAHAGQPQVCEAIDVDLRARVWRAMSRQPIVMIFDDGSVSIRGSVDGPSRLSEETRARHDGTFSGTWGTPTPDVSLSVTIRTKNFDVRTGSHLPPRVEVAVSRDLADGTRCREAWLGLATESL